MSIAYRDSAAAASSSPAAQLAVTVPATVQEGDYVVLAAGFLSSAAVADTVTAASDGTVPVPLGGTVYISGAGNARLFGFAAVASDAGKTVVFAAVSGASYDIGAAVTAYSGCWGADVAAAPATGTAVPLASPEALTNAAGDWAACAAVTASASSVSFTSTPYATVRQVAGTCRAALCDSDAGVGAAGTVVGSGDWSWAASGFSGAAFTLALRAAPSPLPAAKNPAYAAARAGLPSDAQAVNQSAQVNQFLTSHGVTPVYQGARVWSVATPSGTTDTDFYWVDPGNIAGGYGWLPDYDVDQPFTMPAGVTAVGRVTVAVQAAGSGAGLKVTLYPDDGSGNPDTASPLASAYVPASHLTAMSAVTGLPGGPLATARYNTALAGPPAAAAWTPPSVSLNGAGTYATPVTSGNWTLFLGGYDGTAHAAATAVSAVRYLGAGTVSGAAPAPPLPQGAWYMAAAATADTLIAAGGVNEVPAYFADVWTAPWAPGTGTAGSWTAQASLPAAAVNAAMVTWTAPSGAGYVYVLGGSTQSSPATATAAVWTAGVSGGQITGWSAGPPLPQPLNDPYAGVTGDWLVVAGGQDTSGTATAATWYAAINADGSLSGWMPGPDLAAPAYAFSPAWNLALAGSAVMIVSGPTTGGAYLPLTQVLTVTADGPAPQWELQDFSLGVDGEFQCAAYPAGPGGQWELVGFFSSSVIAAAVYPVPLASVPLPATGLTPGAVYHLLFHQDGGTDASYLQLGEMSSASGTQWLYRARGGSGAWTAHTGHEIAVDIYDQTPGGPPLHLVEDSGARVTTLVYSGAPGQLLGVMEAAEFPAGSPETALASVAQVTYNSGGLPSGVVNLA